MRLLREKIHIRWLVSLLVFLLVLLFNRFSHSPPFTPFASTGSSRKMLFRTFRLLHIAHWPMHHCQCIPPHGCCRFFINFLTGWKAATVLAGTCPEVSENFQRALKSSHVKIQEQLRGGNRGGNSEERRVWGEATVRGGNPEKATPRRQLIKALKKAALTALGDERVEFGLSSRCTSRRECSKSNRPLCILFWHFVFNLFNIKQCSGPSESLNFRIRPLPASDYLPKQSGVWSSERLPNSVH